MKLFLGTGFRGNYFATMIIFGLNILEENFWCKPDLEKMILQS